jgi:hypothetical protein
MRYEKKNFWKKFGKFGGMYYLCSMNIKYEISREQVKSIFGNLINQNKFLWYMRLDWNLPIKKNRKGEEVLDISKIGDVTDYIVNHWEYMSCRDTIRNMYVLSDKYKNCRNAKENFKIFQEMYREDGYTNYEYPFVANNYDGYDGDGISND